MSSQPSPEEGNPNDARADEIRAKAIAAAPHHGRQLSSARDGGRLSAIMLPFFLLLSTPRGQGVLTTTGRKTGKARRKCVRAIRRAGVVYLVMLRPPALAMHRPTALASWVWNIRADPNVRLRLGRRTYSGVAREITDANELEIARAAFCETVHLIDYGECDLHLRGLPTRSKVKALHRYWFETGVAVVVKLDC